MTRDERLKDCRLYHGESEFQASADDNLFFYWEAEKLYSRLDSNPEFARDVVAECMKENLASSYLDIPLELVACLYATFCHARGNDEYATAPYFKRDFMPKYLALPR